MNNKLRCSLWNVCSLNKKVNEVMEHLSDHECDIAFFTETWLTLERNRITADIKDHGFTLKHNIRNNPEKERGGGVGIAFKSTFSPTQVVSKLFTSFEHTVVKLPCVNNKSIILISIYRLQYVPIATFLDEFADLLEMYTVLHNSFVIAGDINIHVESEEPASRKFHELMDLFELKQHAVGPTHVMGHTIDVVITRNKNNLISDVVVTNYKLSHHFLIDFVFNAVPSQVFTKTITYRSIKSIDKEALREDITNSYDNRHQCVEVGEKVNTYNAVMKEVLDKHAPVKTKVIRIKSHAPWFDAEYASLRRRRRIAEKKYRNSKTQEDKDEYRALQKQTTDLALEKKKMYVNEKLEDKSSKTLYTVVNNLLDNNKEIVLPSSHSNPDLANEFRKFFSEKIEKIRASIKQTPQQETHIIPPNIVPLSQFRLATADEIRQISMSFEIKCSPDDPLPATVLKENLDLFIPYWLEIVNLSLESGNMDNLKNAVIFPLIKELGSLVDKETFSF